MITLCSTKARLSELYLYSELVRVNRKKAAEIAVDKLCPLQAVKVCRGLRYVLYFACAAVYAVLFLKATLFTLYSLGRYVPF